MAAIVLATPLAFADDVDVEPAVTDGNPLVPGSMHNLTAGVTINDGSTIMSYKWEQVFEEDAAGDPAGVAVVFGHALPVPEPTETEDPTVTLGTATDYAAYLVQVLEEPPISLADLPPGIKLQPYNEIEKGLQSDRPQVVAINPFSLEKAETIQLQVTVTTTSGVYSGVVDVPTELEWVVNTGVKTVPVNVPVLLFAPDGPGPYAWTGMHNGAMTTLTDDNQQIAWFTPGETGRYDLTESSSGTNLTVFAGTYQGVIDPAATLTAVQSGQSDPMFETSCTTCHNDAIAPDNFTPWSHTGHATAFSEAVTSNTHFGTGCFACHTTGFGRDNAGGFDNRTGYGDFLVYLAAAQGSNDVSDVWEHTLEFQPDVARLANVQCEDCHGPQAATQLNGGTPGAHRDQPGAPRVSLQAEVCGSCHGEPFRHGRFQQWQLSSHADYDLAEERGLNGNCGRCHSGNGFIDWSQHGFDPAYQHSNPLPWDVASVVPQTCQTCHDPHDTGTRSGLDTDAKVRIQGTTNLLLAGFVAPTVGKAATCMTCHNSRAGAPHTDANWDNLTVSQKTGSPHHGVQADLLMGQNAFFVAQGDLVRGKHSLLPDVCITCHMEKTAPPPALSFMDAPGTNHTFAADPLICSQCHGDNSITAENISLIINTYLDDLKAELSAAWMRLMQANYPIVVGGDCGTADVSNKGKNGVNNPITDVEWVYHRGTELTITVNGTTCEGLDPADVIVGKVFNNGKNNTSLEDLALEPGNDVLYKAGWNYGLLYEDSAGATDHPGARGVHNPDFSIKALTGAIAGVEGLNP